MAHSVARMCQTECSRKVGTGNQTAGTSLRIDTVTWVNGITSSLDGEIYDTVFTPLYAAAYNVFSSFRAAYN